MKKIYVFAPSNLATGGPELLHQLCYVLRNFGYDACMCYYRFNKNKHRTPVCEAYTEYNNPYICEEELADDSNHIIVLPETYFKGVYRYRKSKIVFWWLSVDNFYGSSIRGLHRVYKSTKYIIRFRFPFVTTAKKVFRNTNIYHLTQSQYAFSHCLSNVSAPANRVFYVSDYLNSLFIKEAFANDINNKENIVLYNPQKGYKFTKKLMEHGTNIKWIPLINLTRIEMAELLKKSKVYIDFGNHPGKDRIPREAAISGCCVITGKKGSAAFKEDIPIPEEFKFDDKLCQYDNIITLINKMFNDYNKYYEKYNKYRTMILAEEKKFYCDVKETFNVIMNDDTF